MPKAILELEMPESCLNCPCIAIDAWGKPKCRIIHSNNGLADAFSSGRRTDCPLKMVEGKNNKPLTIETLETLIGEPVYSPKCGWGIVGEKNYGYEKEANYFHRLTIGFGNRWEWAEDILRIGPIYRHKPEKEVE